MIQCMEIGPEDSSSQVAGYRIYVLTTAIKLHSSAQMVLYNFQPRKGKYC